MRRKEKENNKVEKEGYNLSESKSQTLCEIHNRLSEISVWLQVIAMCQLKSVGFSVNSKDGNMSDLLWNTPLLCDGEHEPLETKNVPYSSKS